jgi:hypothetical protein
MGQRVDIKREDILRKLFSWQKKREREKNEKYVGALLWPEL